MINKPLVENLTAELIARGIDYLHVDPFVSSHAANESDNMEIDAIAKQWAKVAHDAKAAIGLAHHVSKAGAGVVTALSARGAVALINACRSVLTINRMSEEEAKGAECPQLGGSGPAAFGSRYDHVANVLSFGRRACRRFCDSRMSEPGGKRNDGLRSAAKLSRR